MLSVFAVALALLAQPNDDPSVWQTIGRDGDGTTVLLNPDTVMNGENGPEAMVRFRYASARAGGAVLADYRTLFDCAGRSVTQELMGERDINGEIVSRHDEGQRVPSMSGLSAPMRQVLTQVCEMTAGG